MTTQEQGVPKYFADFVQENARQHQDLGDRVSGAETSLGNRISGVEGELRIIKGLVVAIAGMVAVAVIKYVFGL